MINIPSISQAQMQTNRGWYVGGNNFGYNINNNHYRRIPDKDVYYNLSGVYIVSNGPGSYYHYVRQNIDNQQTAFDRNYYYNYDSKGAYSSHLVYYPEEYYKKHYYGPHVEPEEKKENAKVTLNEAYNYPIYFDD